MKCFLILVVILSSSLCFAHRDSDIDNLKECLLNKESLESGDLNVSCNDLYHLYAAPDVKVTKKPSNIRLGAFNIFKLGSGDSRFKDLKLTANIIKNYDLVAVSELHHSTSEESVSNLNLLKFENLNFKELYHKPSYLKLLLELRRSNPAWSLILSPSGQSDNEELLGFYYRADLVELENSKYCKLYNRSLRKKENLVFSGGFAGPSFKRKFESPYLNKSYACILNIKKNENDIFRIPFTARFKLGGSGFDFQMLSYHARFQSPIAIGGSCGFECLEKVNSFLNKTFHKEGSFLKTLDYNSLRFLKKHLDFLSLKSPVKNALHEDYGSVIKFKYSKPRIFQHLMKAKSFLKLRLDSVAHNVWSSKFKGKLSAKDRDYIVSSVKKIFDSLEGYSEFKSFINNEVEKQSSTSSLKNLRKNFLKDVLNSEDFYEVRKRYSLWISPEKIARFNEVALVLNEMEEIAFVEKDKDVLLGGDLNLDDSKNKYYWNFFKDHFKYSTVAIGSKTSIGEKNGLRSAYDHFMYDEENSLEECQPLEASVLDFVNEEVYWEGFENYFVRSKSQIDNVSKIQRARISKIKYVDSKGHAVSTGEIQVRSGYKSCWDNQVYKPASLEDVWVNSFECKTLNQYLNGPQRFRLFTDLISDHLPIGMKCSKTGDLD